MVCTKLRERGISPRAAKQIRIGIAMGEVVYNLYVKDEITAARLALIKASKTSKRTYLATLHTMANRMGCTSDQVVL